MICAGIDAGSRAIKVVVFNHDSGRILATGIADQGIEQQRLADELYDKTLRDAGLTREQVGAIVATGYGRNTVRLAHATLSEITCHARGVYHLKPDARAVIEIGGQDSKVIHLANGGQVRDFAMNDRCAAGTGRFLEMLAARLGIALDELDKLASASRHPAVINSTCVVFAETEIIGLLAEGVPVPDIVAGVEKAIASRLISLVGRNVTGPVYFTGGVALLSGMARALEQALGVAIQAVPMPQYTGALGAALLAAEYGALGPCTESG